MSTGVVRTRVRNNDGRWVDLAISPNLTHGGWDVYTVSSSGWYQRHLGTVQTDGEAFRSVAQDGSQGGLCLSLKGCAQGLGIFQPAVPYIEQEVERALID